MAAHRSPLAYLALALMLLSGCVTQQNDDPAAGTTPPTTSSEPLAPIKTTFTDRLAGTPVAPGEKIHEFDVEARVVDIKADLTWASAASALSFSLLDPSGKNQGSGFPESDTKSSVATVEPPLPGKWKIIVRTQRAVDEAYTVAITLTREVVTTAELKDTKSIAARQFLEANLVMEENATLTYKWKVVEADGMIYFNVHSHKDGVTTNHVEKTAHEGEGTFTAMRRDIFSLLWENEGVAPLSVEYTVAGAFRVHSVGG
ncbi:MAG: hypothetical protein HY556_02540 [Euryarchaeota archaeon]|nr:hypothetical protein [Euryarchaeota archaeon]